MIQRLEIELNSARHSTPLVVRLAGKQNLTQETPRYITTTDQIKNHRVSPIEQADTWQAKGAWQTIWWDVVVRGGDEVVNQAVMYIIIRIVAISLSRKEVYSQ